MIFRINFKKIPEVQNWIEQIVRLGYHICTIQKLLVSYSTKNEINSINNEKPTLLRR